MAPSTRKVLIASILFAASVSAQVPTSCTNVAAIVQQCANGATDENTLLSSSVVNCICGNDSDFDSEIVACLKAAGTSDPTLQQALNGFDGYCSQLFQGGGGSLPTTTDDSSFPTTTDSSDDSSMTSAPTGTVDSDGLEDCTSVQLAVQSCVTNTAGAFPTTGATVNCLCGAQAEGDFDSLLETCGAAVDPNSEFGQGIAAFEGYCSSYYGGSSGSMTSSPSRPTATTSRGGLSTPAATDIETSRVIGNGNPTQTGSGTQSTGGNTQSTNAPSSAAGLKTTFLGSAIAALFVGIAMLL